MLCKIIYKLITPVSLLAIMISCSSGESYSIDHSSKYAKIDRLIKEHNYEEAKNKVEKLLMANPFDETAAQQLKIINELQLAEFNKNQKAIICPIDSIEE